MVDYLIEKLNSEMSTFLYFLIGIVAGIIIVCVVYKLISIRKRKPSEPKDIVDIADITKIAVQNFLNDEGEMDFQIKLISFVNSFNLVADGIADRYYFKGIKKYTFLEGGKFTPNGIKTILEFDIYDLIGFADNLLITMQNSLESTLNGSQFRLAYKVSRVFLRKFDKDPTEAKLSYIADVVMHDDRNDKPSLAGKVKKFLGNKIAKPILGIVVKKFSPNIVAVVDDFFVSVLIGVANDINLLYSGNLGDGVVSVNLISCNEEAREMRQIEYRGDDEI